MNRILFNCQMFKPYNPNLSNNWVISKCSTKHLCKWLENVMGKQSSTQFFWFMIANRCQKMNRVLIVSPINQQKCNDAHSQGFWCGNVFIVWSHINDTVFFFSIMNHERISTFLILHFCLAKYSYEPKLKRIFEISIFYSDWPKSWILRIWNI